MTTLAGSTPGYADGTGTAAQFASPAGIGIDAQGNLYVSEFTNHKLRKITPAGVVTTFAGSNGGYADAGALGAQFNNPYGLSIDAQGILYVADRGNYKVRKIVGE